MPEFTSIPLNTQPGETIYRHSRDSWRDVGIDNYRQPPAQNPDLFLQLNNVQPPITNVLLRRWGTSAFLPKLDAGASTSDDQTATGAPVQSIKATNLYEYSSIAAGKRATIATAADGTGVASLTNKVLYWDAASTPQQIFNPSAGATRPRALDSRDYAYFVDGVVADAQKWNLTAGTTKWGIAAPATALTVSPFSTGGSTTYPLTSVNAASGGNTVYNNTGGGMTAINNGTTVVVSGFVNAANNGTFTVVSTTATSVTLNNPGGLAETNPGTLATENALYPTVSLNGWAANAHVGSYEGGVNQGYLFGLNASATSTYLNPGNAIDGQESTFASGVGQATHNYFGCVYAFGAPPGAVTNPQLKILSEVPPTGTDGKNVTARSAGIWYSLDAGVSWIQVYNTANRTKQWDIINLPSGQTIANVQVMVFTDSHDDMYHKVYEIKITATIAGNGPITLNKGRYYYSIFQNTTSGHLSDLSPSSVLTGPVSGGLINVSGIPTTTDPQVNKVILLATLDGGNQQILYFVASLPIGTTTYQDSTPDNLLAQNNTYLSVDSEGNEHGVSFNDPPPNGSFPIKHRGRLYMLLNNVLFFSKNIADLTTSTGLIAGKYEESWPPDFQLDISEGAEKGVGLFSDGQVLYIGTARRIRRLRGDSPFNFIPPETVHNEVGLNNQDTWQAIYNEGTPAGVMWLTPDFRVIRSDFNTYVNVGEAIQTTLNTINPAASQTAWATFVGIGAYNFYVLGIPTGVNTNPDTLCIYNVPTGRWFTWQFADNVLSVSYYVNLAGIPRFLVNTADGSIYLVDPTKVMDHQSSGQVAVAVTSTIQTSWTGLGDNTLRKALNEIEVNTSLTNLTVTVEGATTNADFNAPTTILSNVPFTSNFLGDLKVFLAGLQTTFRFYRFTFTAISASTNTPNDVVLGKTSVEVMPLHRY